MRERLRRFAVVGLVAACRASGVAATMPPDAGRAYPAGGEDMGYLVWRKRNCCVL